MEPVDTLRSLKLKKTAHYNVTTVLIGFISVILWCQHKGIIPNFSLSLRMSWLLQVTWLFYWQHLCINRKPTLKRQLLWITILKKPHWNPKITPKFTVFERKSQNEQILKKHHSQQQQGRRIFQGRFSFSESWPLWTRRRWVC